MNGLKLDINQSDIKMCTTSVDFIAIARTKNPKKIAIVRQLFEVFSVIFSNVNVNGFSWNAELLLYTVNELLFI